MPNLPIFKERSAMACGSRAGGKCQAGRSLTRLSFNPLHVTCASHLGVLLPIFQCLRTSKQPRESSIKTLI
ncbi:hypothetical protein Cob_v005162 [Colletotrichum orbiculare MAFF 240422]|uniref:Uncharacterized protein n=1 Tax=Colletotrichum orbiculare (strain 104-T / ATCC 96160 / CBS 514.97 / LARS 414 / MAFF 240422) TaxID=1213857 RepID=A0A484FY43_COLOR|nr:hypothetical protein Cob_v005162 [Colletotrichum orbiculare MAFF 240422]